MGVNCKVEKVSDIGKVAEVDSDDEEHTGRIVKKVATGEIDGVLSYEEYPSCISCKAKIKPMSEFIGECTKRGMVVKMAKCKNLSMAKVVVSGEDAEHCVVTMFNECN